MTNDSCPRTFAVDDLGKRLIDAGYSFAGYSEDLPSIGYSGCGSGKYQRKHAPWVNFSNLSTSTNRPFSTFPADYATLPTLSYVIPNLCNDRHACSVSTGDTWLKNQLKGYGDWAKTHNSLLVVDFDEDDFTATNRIPTIFSGQRVKAGLHRKGHPPRRPAHARGHVRPVLPGRSRQRQLHRRRPDSGGRHSVAVEHGVQRRQQEAGPSRYVMNAGGGH